MALHLVGNQNIYISKNLGNTGYVRDRAAEFNSNTSKADLVQKAADTKAIVLSVLSNLNFEDLPKSYPEDILGYE